MLIQKKMYAGINRNYAMGNNANYKNEAISAAKLQAKVIGESFAKDLGKSAALTKSLSVVAQTLPLDKVELPPVKVHCSILAEDAIKAAVADYKKKHQE